jgi:hypothetical protein
MRRAGLLDAIDPRVWSTEWVVHSKAVGDGEHAFRYLATYVFRVAISSHRIVSFSEADRSVVFRYTDRQTGQHKLCRLDAFEFLRRFLQHVLPSGFMKVRHYGFLHPNCSVPLDEVRRLAAQALDRPVPRTAAPTEKPVFACPECGAPMVYVRTILGPRVRPMLDTG